ncbi:DUF2730 family protein [Emcibacter sp.]|uniref:DUF2730 family protein n=1 Tax=Emcibacter sp. TaxID=1979954 RepID=UPI003B639309
MPRAVWIAKKKKRGSLLLEVIEFIKAIWPIIATLASGGAAVLFLVARSKFVSKEDHVAHQKVIEQQHKEINAKLVVFEKELVRMPSDIHVQKLGLEVEELNGEIKALKATINGIHGQYGRVEKFLDMLIQNELENSKK